MAAVDDFREFVESVVERSNIYQRWAADHAGAGTVAQPEPGSELHRWQTFRDAVLAGEPVAAPPMDSRVGRSLIEVAVMTRQYVLLMGDE